MWKCKECENELYVIDNIRKIQPNGNPNWQPNYIKPIYICTNCGKLDLNLKNIGKLEE